MVTSKREDRSRILRCVDQSVAEEARTEVLRARLSLGVLFSWQKFQSVRLPYGSLLTASTILWSTLDPAPSRASLHHPLGPALTRQCQWLVLQGAQVVVSEAHALCSSTYPRPLSG